jgi:hypothetical protein
MREYRVPESIAAALNMASSLALLVFVGAGHPDDF